MVGSEGDSDVGGGAAGAAGDAFLYSVRVDNGGADGVGGVTMKGEAGDPFGVLTALEDSSAFTDVERLDAHGDIVERGTQTFHFRADVVVDDTKGVR